MNINGRRPDGWTSADAAGLAIFPGLVRYDEAFNPSVAEIRHAFRVTVRTTNGYVYPASHRAGSTSGALPMGARLRLKTNVNGLDPALRTNDPNLQKIFRAMQKYGLIVADNGSDMYITGTFDTRWNNDILNPAFAALTASDFEVIQLGWIPAPSGSPTLNAVNASPGSVVGGNTSSGTVALTAPAPAGGIAVSLASASSAFSVPSSVTVVQGASSAGFAITTSPVSVTTAGTLSATYNGVTKTATVTVNPPPAPTLSALALNPASVTGGFNSVGKVTLTASAAAGGASVALSSSNASLASVPASITVPQGATSQDFIITTKKPAKNTPVTLFAVHNGVTKTAGLTVKRR
jgi:hypothetical protein